tara:strand:- start:509 stop:670 length:162 start_codon:yes stop_codon:yes gene_type:complete
MRLTEYMHFINRMDIGISENPGHSDYNHITLSYRQKRARYLLQCRVRGKKPVK